MTCTQTPADWVIGSLQPLSSRLIVGWWNPRHSHRPLLIAFQFLPTVPPMLPKGMFSFWMWFWSSSTRSLRRRGMRSMKAKFKISLSAWFRPWKEKIQITCLVEQRDRNHHLGEVENLLTSAGISIETGRLVTGWEVGSRLVVYFCQGLTFENSAIGHICLELAEWLNQNHFIDRNGMPENYKEIYEENSPDQGLSGCHLIYSRKIMIRFVCSCLFSYSSLTLGGFDPNPHRCLYSHWFGLLLIQDSWERQRCAYSSCQGFLAES